METVIVLTLVIACALYWVTRLFPGSAHRVRRTLGLASATAAPAPSRGKCGGCSGCGDGGGCH